jgi:phosphatidylinositol 3,5-bisphosphate 5-phosphatase
MLDEREAYELRELSKRGDAPDRSHEQAEDAALLASPRRFSMSSVQSYELYTPDEDKAVLKRLDRRLVLFMALLYSLSFLDRSSE